MKSTVTFLLACVALTLLSRWWTRPQAGRCDLDGTRIEPVYAVEVMHRDPTGAPQHHTFCSIVCAKLYLEQHPHPETITVHDEVTGEAVSARRVQYVRSEVPTMASVRNDVHVFVDWAAALQHIDTWNGTFVENPFGPWLAAPAEDPTKDEVPDGAQH